MTRHPHRDGAHHHPPQIRGAHAVDAPTHSRCPAAAAAALLLISAGALPASARPEPWPPPAAASAPTMGQQTCPLTRLGAQLVRCDNLTGAGAPAPLWVPGR